MIGLLHAPLYGLGGTADVLNPQFDNWTGGTTRTFTTANAGSTWSPTSPASGIPDDWSANNGSYYGNNTQTVDRAAYAIGGGSDAGAHGSYVCRLQAGTSIQQSIAIPAAAAGQTITVKVWLKQPTPRGAVAVISLGGNTASASSSGDGSWQLVTLTIGTGHGFAGTSQTLKITAHNYAGFSNFTEVASASITIP